MPASKKQVNKLSFTEKRIAELPAAKPKDGQLGTARYYVYDERVPGLAVCVTASGSKTYYACKRAGGRWIRIRLGLTAELSVAKAREAAVNLVSQMVQGIDPQAAKRAKREELTLADAWEHWKMHSEDRKKSWSEDERQWNAFLKPWASRRLSTIETRHVTQLHAKIGRENGQYAANRMLSLLSSLFNAAAGRNKGKRKMPGLGYTGLNPTEGVERFPERKRDRFLKANELPLFFEALEELSPLMQDFFVVAILSGARRSNVQAMRWDEIDPYTKLWRVSEEKAKAGKVMMVQLSEPVLAILERRRELSNGSPWVFPSYGKTGHLVEPKRAWKTLRERADIVDVRFHDLRRSLGSWMTINGSSIPIVGKALGHTQSRTTEIYARLSNDPVAQAVGEAGDKILTLGGWAPPQQEPADMDGNLGAGI